jgi:hypothetical protein
VTHPSIALNARNYLLVSIDLPSASVARFAGLMKKLLPTFTSPVPTDSAQNLTFGWTLVGAFKTARGRSTRITHLWQVNPSKPWMTDVMGECGTNRTYAALDLLVDREEQNYMYSNDEYLPAGSTWPARLPKSCAIETLEVTRFPAKLNDFEVGTSLLSDSGMDSLMGRAQQKHGWTLLLPMTPETGLLRQFVHVWAIQKGGTQNLATFKRWLLSQPEYKAAVHSTDIMAAEPLVYGTSPPRGRS